MHDDGRSDIQDHFSSSTSTAIYKPGVHLRCPECNAVNSKTFSVCVNCGFNLKAQFQPRTFIPPAAGGKTAVLERLPDNTKARAAYYAGLTAIIPVVGLVSGPVAIVCGLLGLAYAKECEKATGRRQALIGILVGSLALAVNLLLLLVYFFLHERM